MPRIFYPPAADRLVGIGVKMCELLVATVYKKNCAYLLPFHLQNFLYGSDSVDLPVLTQYLALGIEKKDDLVFFLLIHWQMAKMFAVIHSIITQGVDRYSGDYITMSPHV